MVGDFRPIWAVTLLLLGMAAIASTDVLSLHYFENYISFLPVNLFFWRKKYAREVCSKILDTMQVKA